MKKLPLIITMLAFSAFIFAQRFAYVDTEYILNNVPTYETAKTQLDEFSKNWKDEIDVMKNNIDKMYKDYQSERVLLTEELRLKREEEIMNKEKIMRELQQKYFGKDGMLFKKREELIKPLQDNIYNAIKEIAQEGNLDVIYDTADNVNMIYTNPRYDKSDDVLKKMGFKN
ncbi:MAG: OmpH family outer membrane protein [Bacteroidales bacterium]|jgi:outer membrane protein|nr:OmpH family outer membrane protein [Bacteroidales bacterium]